MAGCSDGGDGGDDGDNGDDDSYGGFLAGLSL
jgi:hypothetical protein